MEDAKLDVCMGNIYSRTLKQKESKRRWEKHSFLLRTHSAASLERHFVFNFGRLARCLERLWPREGGTFALINHSRVITAVRNGSPKFRLHM